MKDEKELLLSIDELGGREAKEIVVDKIAGLVLDGKESEREATVSMVALLVEKKKLGKAEVEAGLKDTVEFLEDVKIDAPMAVRNFVGLAKALIEKGGLGKDWLKERVEEFVRDEENKKELLEGIE